MYVRSKLTFVRFFTHTKNVYLNPKPPRNDHQVNQTQRSPIKGKTTDVKLNNKSLQDLRVVHNVQHYKPTHKNITH